MKFLHKSNTHKKILPILCFPSHYNRDLSINEIYFLIAVKLLYSELDILIIAS